MNYSNFAAEAAKSMLQFAQRPDSGENVAVLVGTYDKKGRAAAVLWTGGCAIPLDEVHGVWATDTGYGEIHYEKASEEDFKYGVFAESGDAMHFYIQLPDRQHGARVVMARDLLVTAVAGDYIFIFHAARDKFARFAYSNKPLLKAEMDLLTFEAQRTLIECLQFNFENAQEGR